MTRPLPAFLAATLLAAAGAHLAHADAVVLTNGHVIEADRVWYEGSEVRYTRNGGTFGVPRSLVQSVSAVVPVAGAGPAATSPPATPTAVARPTVAARPAPPARPTAPGRFRIRYEGGTDEALGLAVLDELHLAHGDFARHLGFDPSDPVTVVLEMGSVPDQRLPEWAAGMNDGTIHLPVSGVPPTSARLRELLRHELAHTFVTWRTGGNCPTWLQEGIAQWLEGGEVTREDAGLAPLARDGHLPALLTLEGPFQSLSPDDVTLAYAESLSAVSHILRKRGEPGLGRLLAALGDRVPSDEALPTALGLSYPEFQRSWEEALAPRPAPLAGRRNTPVD